MPVKQRNKPVLVAAAVAAVLAAVARRRQAQADADLLWREATSDVAH